MFDIQVQLLVGGREKPPLRFDKVEVWVRSALPYQNHSFFNGRKTGRALLRPFATPRKYGPPAALMVF
jgi:hypothetical protein